MPPTGGMRDVATASAKQTIAATPSAPRRERVMRCCRPGRMRRLGRTRAASIDGCTAERIESIVPTPTPAATMPGVSTMAWGVELM